MLVRKTDVVPIECVVRGYLAGSGLDRVSPTGSVCGIKLPAGIGRKPATRRANLHAGHQGRAGTRREHRFAEMARRVGRDVAEELRERSIAVYLRGAEHARGRGILIADTKFEWGQLAGELILIDEVLTPDSSRLWPADQYSRGRGQPRSTSSSSAIGSWEHVGQEQSAARIADGSGRRDAWQIRRGVRAIDRSRVADALAQVRARVQIAIR